MTCKVGETASTSGHFRRVSPAALKAAWLDPSRTVASIADEFNLCPRTISRRIKAMGLSVRSYATKKPSISDDQCPAFVVAWQAGVSSPDIARHFGVSDRTVANTARRLNLAPRRPGTKPRATMNDLWQSRLAAMMAREARIEQAAMINAEMADCVMTGRMVGASHVRGLM